MLRDTVPLSRPTIPTPDGCTYEAREAGFAESPDSEQLATLLWVNPVEATSAAKPGSAPWGFWTSHALPPDLKLTFLTPLATQYPSPSSLVGRNLHVLLLLLC